MSAKKSTLETLHEMLTELFIEDIKICRSEGIPMSASDKAVIVKFLKDNDVTTAPDEAKVQALRDEFQDELAAKREVTVVDYRTDPDTGEAVEVPVVHTESYDTGEKRLVTAAGNRWGIRPDQCLFLEAKLQRRNYERLLVRIEALEGKQ